MHRGIGVSIKMPTATENLRMGKTPQPRRRTSRAIIGLAILAAVCATAEGVLRSSEPQVSGPAIQTQIEIADRIADPPFVPDRELGAVMKPSGRYLIETPDYRYTLQVDHGGFPNLDPWPDQVDVAVLGNSLIAGVGVGYEGQFTTLLEREFGAGKVLNFGVHGGGTEHQLRVYRKFAAPLRPKIVIATLWLTWEIDNTLKFHDWLIEGGQSDFSTYAKALPSKGVLERARSVLRKADEIRVVRIVHEWTKKLRGIREPDIDRAVLKNGEVMHLSSSTESRLTTGWHRARTPEVSSIFFKPLEHLKVEVEGSGARFLVVLVPCKEELYAAAEFPEVLRAAQEARKELATRRIPTLDLYPVFAEVASLRAAFFRTDQHPNAFGHRVLAQALAKELNVYKDRSGLTFPRKTRTGQK